MGDFIKLMVVYQANPTKRNQTENDMLMRETYIRASDILEITPVVPDDEAVIAKCYIRTLTSSSLISVMDIAEDILAAIVRATAIV